MFAFDTIKIKNETNPPQIPPISKRSSASFSHIGEKSKSYRIIRRNGQSNTFLWRIPKKHLSYAMDWGNTLLSIRWRWILLTVCLLNFTGYYLFGLLWMWLAYISGDFDENPQEFCVVNTNTLTGYILLSVETITTIGFGHRYPTEKCVQGWILIILQSFVSLAMQGAFVSVIYAKLAKPFTKANHLFSRKAVICLRDGELCFIIRLTDSVGKVSVGTNVTMYFVDKDDIEAKPSVCIKQMAVEPYGLLLFPSEIVHVIDTSSPLWKCTPTQLLGKKFEIIVVVEGSSTITGQLSQHRTSYINSDVMWGHRFRPCVEFNTNKMKYIVNYKEINKTIPFDTALCSPKHLWQIRQNTTFKQ